MFIIEFKNKSLNFSSKISRGGSKLTKNELILNQPKRPFVMVASPIFNNLNAFK